MEQASMKACAMTDRQASMWSVFSMSKTNWGFFKMFTQKRRGRLWGRDSGGAGTQWGAWEVNNADSHSPCSLWAPRPSPASYRQPSPQRASLP